jgi:diguanylate cyclase (GGDEF)-like protein
VREPISAVDDGIFMPYRERVLYPIAAVGTAMFLPLGAHHLLHDDPILGAVLMVLVAVLALDAIAISRGRRPPVRFPLLLLPGAVGVLASLVQQGVYGALWAYPMALFGYFVLPRARANAVSAALLAVCTALVYAYQGVGLTLRFFLSLGLCLLTLNIILGVAETLQRRLLEQSFTDALTGAFNRRHMDACLAQVIERNRRNGALASIALIDIDHFKTINDRFGHESGDHVLRTVVEIVQRRCRRLDQVFRMGGEEFLLLLPDTRREESALLSEQLRASIAATPMLEGRQVTVSIGVSQLRAGDRADDWLKRVDEALYRAKQGGRDQVLITGRRFAEMPSVLAASRRPTPAV